ncbi:MAG: hypothetical protein ABI315_13930 [Bacteroidia bacterium]
MKTKKRFIEKNGIVVGILTAIAMLAYFFIMKAVGLEQKIELRFFNFIILAVGIVYGINKLKKELNQPEFYLKGIGQGMFIAIVAVAVFAAFMSIYIVYFDIFLLEKIRDNTTVGWSMDPITLFGSLFIEGMAGAAIITFTAMQYLKRQGSNIEPRANRSSTRSRLVEPEKDWRL